MYSVYLLIKNSEFIPLILNIKETSNPIKNGQKT